MLIISLNVYQVLSSQLDIKRKKEKKNQSDWHKREQ